MGTKAAAPEATIECGYETLCFFGTTEITNEIIVHMEKFLLKFCLQQESR